MLLDKITSEAATHQLIGGQLCLDFANTINGHGSVTPHEYLIGYPDLVVWSRRAGLLTDAEAERLLRLAGEGSRETSADTQARHRTARNNLSRFLSAGAEPFS